MHKYLFILLSIFLRFSINAQSVSDYNKKLTKGTVFLLKGKYSLALPALLDAYNIDSSNSNINYKIGLCFINIDGLKNKSLPFFEKAILNTSVNYDDSNAKEKFAPQKAFYFYGQSLLLNEHIDEAITQFEKYKSLQEKKEVITDVNHQIEICKNAKILISAPTNIILKKLNDSINSPYSDYGSVILNNEQIIIYTSRKPETTGGKKNNEGAFFEDIYFSQKKTDSTWTKPESISKNINTDGNEAIVGLSKDEQTIFINKKDINGGDIYSSNYDGADWSIPQPLESNINSPSLETNSCLSPDGNIIYFISNRPNGIGGKDIWKCNKLPNGKWGNAINLGEPINTPYDEESPFVHPNGNILFFSSKGHNTIGGYDIFFSFANENKWEEPMNIGYPINSTDDDLYYVTSPNGENGYFSSARINGNGGKDIYISTKNKSDEEQLVLIKGKVVPVDGEKLPEGIEVLSTNNESGAIGNFRLMKDGSFTIILTPNNKYTLSYLNNGNEFFSEIIDVPAGAVFQEIEKELKLKEVIFDNTKK